MTIDNTAELQNRQMQERLARTMTTDSITPAELAEWKRLIANYISDAPGFQGEEIYFLKKFIIAMPRLIAEVERLQAEIKAVRKSYALYCERTEELENDQ